VWMVVQSEKEDGRGEEGGVGHPCGPVALPLAGLDGCNLSREGRLHMQSSVWDRHCWAQHLPVLHISPCSKSCLQIPKQDHDLGLAYVYVDMNTGGGLRQKPQPVTKGSVLPLNSMKQEAG
jgi:hypothetical protein